MACGHIALSRNCVFCLPRVCCPTYALLFLLYFPSPTTVSHGSPDWWGFFSNTLRPLAYSLKHCCDLVQYK